MLRSLTLLASPSLDSSPRERLSEGEFYRFDSSSLQADSSLFSVHGANRLGGSSLLGCVVFGRVAGDSAASYLLQNVSSQTAASRLGQVGGHLGMATTIRIDPGTQKVHLEFSWADGGASGSSEGGQAGQVKTEEAKAATPAKPAKEEPKQVEQKEYTMEEVSKHNKKDDCWVRRFCSHSRRASLTSTSPLGRHRWTSAQRNQLLVRPYVTCSLTPSPLRRLRRLAAGGGCARRESSRLPRPRRYTLHVSRLTLITPASLHRPRRTQGYPALVSRLSSASNFSAVADRLPLSSTVLDVTLRKNI